VYQIQELQCFISAMVLDDEDFTPWFKKVLDDFLIGKTELKDAQSKLLEMLRNAPYRKVKKYLLSLSEAPVGFSRYKVFMLLWRCRFVTFMTCLNRPSL
jgi:hypothetical protein